MEAVRTLMRYYSFLFHALLAFFLIAISGLALASGSGSLNLGMLPWTGSTLVYILFFGALAGFLTIILAIRGMLRVLFLIWSLLVFVLLVKGYMLSGYKFHAGEFRTAAYLMIASLIAIPGAWFQMRRQVVRKRF